MSKREFTRTLVVVVLSLGLGLAPVVAQAAPNLAGEERGGSIWDVFAPVVRLWEAIWERNERGPGVDPTVHGSPPDPVLQVPSIDAVGEPAEMDALGVRSTDLR